MKIKFSGIAAIIAILTGFVCLYSFRSIPAARIWSSYNVLYAEKLVGEQQILDYLLKAGCKDVISLSYQKIPLRSALIPVEPRLNNYLDSRALYFSDKDKNYNLFYIPSEYEPRTEQALQEIQKKLGIQAGVDGHEEYPVLIPLICLATAIGLWFFAKNKKVFACISLFPVLLSFSLPFFPVASAVCLELLALFMINHIWGRRRYLPAVFTNPWVLAPLVTSIAVFFSVSPSCGLTALIVSLASVGMVFLLRCHELYMESRSDFNYVLIFSAKQLPLMYSRTARATIAIAAVAAILLVTFIFSSLSAPKSSVKGLSVPSPSYSQNPDGEQLPSLSDYFDWAWKTLSFPYINMNSQLNSGINLDFTKEKVKNGSVVTIPRYTQTENGIEKKDEVVMTFDGDFISSLEDGIDKLEYPAIEKLMKSEGAKFTVSYNSSVSGKNTASTVRNGISLVMLSLIFLEILLMYIFYTIIRRKNYESNK